MFESRSAASENPRLDDLRRRIAAGDYESADKIEAAVEAILEDFAAGRLRGGVERPAPNRPR